MAQYLSIYFKIRYVMEKRSRRELDKTNHECKNFFLIFFENYILFMIFYLNVLQIDPMHH